MKHDKVAWFLAVLFVCIYKLLFLAFLYLMLGESVPCLFERCTERQSTQNSFDGTPSGGI